MLMKLRMAIKTLCIILHPLHNYNVTPFTVKHSGYKTAATSYLIVRFPCFNGTLEPSPILNHMTHTHFVQYNYHSAWMQYCTMPILAT